MNKFNVNIKVNFQGITLLLLALLFCTSSFAQKKPKNLVPNPGFEFHKNKGSTIKNAIPWMGEGTVDYYLKPDKKDTSKFKGPHTGKSYAGIRFQPKYKEYMYVKLTEALAEGNTYNFSMYVKFLDNSTATVKQLGVYFSETPFKKGMIFEQDRIIDSTYKKGIAASHGWIPITGKYRSRGGERYIIIGNFRTNMKEDFVRQNKWEVFEMREAYYYIDDVTLLRPDTLISVKHEKKPVHSFPETFVTGQTFLMENIQFEKGSAFLTNNSYLALEELINLLNSRPQMEIQINGHADDEGSLLANMKLSKKRAKAVYKYLSDKTVNPIKFDGFGSTRPLVPNDSDLNRAKNRRIEILIIKQ